MKPDGRRDLQSSISLCNRDQRNVISVYFSLGWNGRRHNYLGFTKKIFSVTNLDIFKEFVCMYDKDSTERLNI